MIIQNSGSWTLCGAVLLFVLPLIPTPEALQHTEEGLEMLFRERWVVNSIDTEPFRCLCLQLLVPNRTGRTCGTRRRTPAAVTSWSASYIGPARRTFTDWHGATKRGRAMMRLGSRRQPRNVSWIEIHSNQRRLEFQTMYNYAIDPLISIWYHLLSFQLMAPPGCTWTMPTCFCEVVDRMETLHRYRTNAAPRRAAPGRNTPSIVHPTSDAITTDWPSTLDLLRYIYIYEQTNIYSLFFFVVVVVDVLVVVK